MKSNTIAGLLSHAYETKSNRLALIDASVTVTYAELFHMAAQFTSAIAAFGLERRDRVAVLLPSNVTFAAIHFGVLGLGAISVPLDMMMNASELAATVKCTQPLLLVTNKEISARLSDSDVLSNPWLLVLTVEYFEGNLQSQVVRQWASNAREARRTVVSGGDCDVLMFTNGTSGVPKGVMLCDANVLAVVNSVEKFVGYEESDKEVIALPLSHSFGLGQLYVCISKGACACLGPEMVFPARMFDTVRRFKATGFSCTPATLALLLKSCPNFFTECSDHLKYCVVNSAPVSQEIVGRILALNCKLRIFHYYGLTEASRTTFICFNDALDKRASVGRPMEHAWVKIINGEGTGLTSGQLGQIAISGTAIFRGYWRDPDSHVQVTNDGWFYSGDLGYLDDDGFLFWIGRLGDTINIDGLKFHPAEVEAVLTGMNGVLEAGVTTVEEESEIVGARVVALVVCADGDSLDQNKLRAECARKLRSFKVPKIVFAVERIPRLASGKVDRKGLRNLAQDLTHRC